jgi:tRNA(fMet)-specific endonuclease VapC
MPATHLLDTSVFSQPLKRKPVTVALDRWAALGDVRCAVSVISEAEVRYGIEWAGAATQRHEFETALVGRLPILIVDSAVAQAYAVIRADLRRRGHPVGEMDMLIAATAKANNLIVATLNVRDFEKVNGLTVEDWSQT